MTIARKMAAEAKQQGVDLVAGGKLTEEQIAAQLKVCRRTVSTWKADADFQKAVRERRNAWRVKARGEGLSDQDWRLRNANDLMKRLRGVILERAKAENMQEAPGGKTGMLTVTYKMQSMGEGLGSQAIAEYRVDTPTVEAIRSLQEYVAIEKGQWNQKLKVEHSGQSLAAITAELAAGRKRVADFKAKRDADARLPVA